MRGALRAGVAANYRHRKRYIYVVVILQPVNIDSSFFNAWCITVE